MLGTIDFRPGLVVFNDFKLDSHMPVTTQLGRLKEDLLQVRYPSGHIIDVGWYPSFDPEGSFRVVLVRETDWERPPRDARCTTYSALEQELSACVDFVRSLLDRHPRRYPIGVRQVGESRNDLRLRVIAIINSWDPVGLMLHAPGDEYDREVDEIMDLIRATTDEESLAQGIYQVFLRQFGNDTFHKSMEDCIRVAREIRCGMLASDT